MTMRDLDIRFQEAFELASKMEKKLPPDTMLKLYAYYKQAVKGDQFAINAYPQAKGLRSAFKLNAWLQLRGMTADVAKTEYIKLVHSRID